jgi:hypothetical protein
MDGRGQLGRRGQRAPTMPPHRLPCCGGRRRCRHGKERLLQSQHQRQRRGGAGGGGEDDPATVLSGALDVAAHLAVAVSVADRAAPPNGEEGASMDDGGSGGKDDGGGGSGKEDGDDKDDDHAGASVVGSICGVDHGRTFGGRCEEIMNNFLHVWSLVVSIPHILASDRVFSRVRRNRYEITVFRPPIPPPPLEIEDRVQHFDAPRNVFLLQPRRPCRAATDTAPHRSGITPSGRIPRSRRHCRIGRIPFRSPQREMQTPTTTRGAVCLRRRQCRQSRRRSWSARCTVLARPVRCARRPTTPA